MNMLRLFPILLFTVLSVTSISAKSTRTERLSVIEGNKLFEQKDYQGAIKLYDKALASNPESRVAIYNRAMAQLFIGLDSNVKDKDMAAKMLEQGTQALQGLTADASQIPDISSKAAYNLGNMAFNKQDLQGAAELYKQSLRYNPNNDMARRNLRIVQLKMQQNKDNNKDKDNKDKDKDKDNNKDKNKDQNRQDNKKQDQQNQQNQHQSGMDKQTSDQVLKSIDNKENQIRQRLQGKKRQQSPRGVPSRKW